MTPSEENQHLFTHYREKYRTAPLGTWSQAVGTFSAMMDESWEFHADHTGTRILSGAFGYPHSEMTFIWREVADYTIECQQVHWFDFDNQGQRVIEHSDEEPEEEEYWDTIRYDFTVAHTDCGGEIVMRELAADGSFADGFWRSDSPLTPGGVLTPTENELLERCTNRPVHADGIDRNQLGLLTFANLCDIFGAFALIACLSEFHKMLSKYVIIGAAMVPVAVFLFTDVELSLHPVWQRCCAIARLIAAIWYLALVAIVVILVAWGFHPRGWWFLLVMLAIGCNEPVGILYRLWKRRT